MTEAGARWLELDGIREAILARVPDCGCVFSDVLFFEKAPHLVVVWTSRLGGPSARFVLLAESKTITFVSEDALICRVTELLLRSGSQLPLFF